nr:immunoglobulin light chain junction region [Macaca mulatta]
FQQESNWPTF